MCLFVVLRVFYFLNDVKKGVFVKLVDKYMIFLSAQK